MMTIKNILLVGLGGGLGSMLRYMIAAAFKQSSFPFTTFLINVTGSLFIGVVFALGVKNESLSAPLKLFLATGICGGFTTFSAFSVENVQLIKEGNYTTAAIYIVASVACCIVACLAGFKIIET
jgi:fluoride exporter